MTNQEAMEAGLIYNPGEADIMDTQLMAMEKLYDFNQTRPGELSKRNVLLHDMLAECGDGCYVEPPLYANWGGSHVYFGEKVYANFGLTLVDDARIYVGDRVLFGPHVTLATASHPIWPTPRDEGWQFNKEIHIGNNVWIGAGAVVCPGVCIGDNTVIGAGSIVTKDIPANVVAVGNPCRVLRPISEHDREYFYKDEKIDWQLIKALQGTAEEEGAEEAEEEPEATNIPAMAESECDEENVAKEVSDAGCVKDVVCDGHPWWESAVFYQIYPLGMCGAPFENDGKQESRILKVLNYVEHLKKMKVNAVYFSPLFESDTHGYNTRDYRKIDTRLGTNEDFIQVVDALHKAGIRVILDGVFNHVGRGFFGFVDVLNHRENSSYRDWFHIDFNGNNGYQDGLWYEGWEGNYDLVKLNLQNPAVCDYLMESVKYWIDTFGIDGLRLDVAYMVDREFLKRLRRETREWKEDFFLAGEMIGGDYREIMNDAMCHSVTNYECRKGIFSAINSNNLFEIVHSLLRQFGTDAWCLYRDYHLISFVDNHDVSRIATVLEDKRNLPIAYGFVFGQPGIPMVYYGSEWGVEGDKANGDPSLRIPIDHPQWNELTDVIAAMAKAHRESPALSYGDFKSLFLENRHCLFQRQFENDRVLVAVNLEDGDYTIHTDFGAGRGRDLITNQWYDFGGGLCVPGHSVLFLHIED
ncbi:Glycosidase [Lachnospiraceae bacterium C10]|nr:Glycosidase [Lachnospiraceae bacterium C10]